MVDGARFQEAKEIEDRYFSELRRRDAIAERRHADSEQRFARLLEMMEGLQRKLNRNETSSSLTTPGANRTEVRAPGHTAVARMSKSDFSVYEEHDKLLQSSAQISSKNMATSSLPTNCSTECQNHLPVVVEEEACNNSEPSTTQVGSDSAARTLERSTELHHEAEQDVVENESVSLWEQQQSLHDEGDRDEVKKGASENEQMPRMESPVAISHEGHQTANNSYGDENPGASLSSTYIGNTLRASYIQDIEQLKKHEIIPKPVMTVSRNHNPIFRLVEDVTGGRWKPFVGVEHMTVVTLALSCINAS